MAESSNSWKWWRDVMSLIGKEEIVIPSGYREQVLAVKDILKNDTSGIVSTMLDFAIDSALVEYRVETDNANLTKALNEWLDGINNSLLGKVPTGLEPLAKEYFRERWKGSSNLLIRTFWDSKNDMSLPNTMYFLDGEDIIVKPKNKNEKIIRLGEAVYHMRVDNNREHDIKLPRLKNENILVQTPFESWGTYYPTPYLIRKGLYHNLKFFKLVSSKSEYIFGRALEYLLVMKKGTEKMALEGRAEMIYDDKDIKQISEDLSTLLQNKKTEKGTPTYTTNFDTDITHLIPDYKLAMNDDMYSPIERRFLSGLGLVDIVEGTASDRREAILNPKPFMSEVKHGVNDFKQLLTDMSKMIVIQNKESHPKWMNAKIKIFSSPIKEFINKDIKQILRNLYDRGLLSKRTATEIIGNVDYDTEVRRREEEKVSGEDEKMEAPVTQKLDTKDTTETTPEKKTDEEVTEDKTGPEAKDFKQATEYEEAPYKRNADLPSSIKTLPPAAQTVWRKAFNQVLKDTNNEDSARKIAWNAVKDSYYKDKNDKWKKKK